MSVNQISAPKAGDTIAIMHTTMGDIKIKLFKDLTKKTFDKFKPKNVSEPFASKAS